MPRRFFGHCSQSQRRQLKRRIFDVGLCLLVSATLWHDVAIEYFGWPSKAFESLNKGKSVEILSELKWHAIEPGQVIAIKHKVEIVIEGLITQPYWRHRIVTAISIGI